MPAAIAALHARRAELNRLAAKLENEGRTMLVEGEEDARPMGKGNGPNLLHTMSRRRSTPTAG
ncbi:MAG: hypothetical protein E5W94_18765 [Mesorhizobium sp.]|nr:MAG: hypothetical protein E5W94_18765 [Mesorhizobium sp.]